jgi:hypothetical protein
MQRRTFLVLAASAVAIPAARGQSAIVATLHKNPNCGCCDVYAGHLEENGFSVALVNTTDLPSVSRAAGVPEHLAGCHTMFVGEYVVEGLVPADIVKRMLAEKPYIKGIALPGMPSGAPGMPGAKAGPLIVYAFGAGEPTVYAEA